MQGRHELTRNFVTEVFEGCDQTWMLGVEEGMLYSYEVPWLRAACKERSIRLTGKNKRDLVETLLEWQQLRMAQVMLWGNPRYCQVSVRHDPHPHQAWRYKDGLAVDNVYECDGRPVRELGV